MLEMLNKAASQQNISTRIEKSLREMFEKTCRAIEEIDGNKFQEQTWKRNEHFKWIPSDCDNHTIYIDRALRNSNVFEKVGVNYVSMQGFLPPGMAFQGPDAVMAASESETTSKESTPFFASSTSFVINPSNPMAPTAHVNYRYFQLGDGTQPGSWWFGGGGDLTPSYLFEEDAVHFHQVHKEACDRHDPSFYPRFKKWCDEYFYLPHRGECRGIGGIFFDYLQDRDADKLCAFVETCSQAFVQAYIPIVEKRKDMEFTEQNRYWQRLRRGRYAEFILLNDRGTRFGLETGIVHTQSVLNCMPSEAFWSYDDLPAPDSQEASLIEILKSPRAWV